MEFTFVLILSAILGIIFHYVDAKVGTKWNTAWYNLTHKNKLPENLSKGFIFKRKFRARFAFSLVVSILAFLVLIIIDSIPFIEACVYAFSALIGLLIGIYISTLFIKKGSTKFSEAIDYIEKLESGEADLKKDILKNAMEIREEIKELNKEQIKGKLRKEVEKEQNKKEDNKTEEENKDWRKGIDDFLNK